MSIERHYTTKQLAELFQLRESTLEKQRAEGRGIRHVRIGGAIRYPESAVREYLNRGMRDDAAIQIA